MTDSDTCGWRNGGRACDYMKDIGVNQYEIHRGRDGQWWTWVYNRNLGAFGLLSDAKRAAHAHAREKK